MWKRWTGGGASSSSAAPAVRKTPVPTASASSSPASINATNSLSESHLSGAAIEQKAGAAAFQQTIQWIESSTAACGGSLDDFKSRCEGRVEHAAVLPPPIEQPADVVYEKEQNHHATPTESDATATEESFGTADALSRDASTESEESAVDQPQPPRMAALDAFASLQVDDTWVDVSDSSSPTVRISNTSGTSSGSGATTRRKKKPIPEGLPPCCVVDGLPPLCGPPAQPLVRRSSHLQSWCSAPVSTPLSQSSAQMNAAAVHEVLAIETRNRAEWVEDSVFSV